MNRERPQVIRAVLVGDDIAIAAGLTVRGHAPLLQLCRQLIEAGVNPRCRLDAYRGDTLCLKVRSIGEVARLTVKERPFGPVFEHWVPLSTPPVSPRIAQKVRAASTLAEAAP